MSDNPEGKTRTQLEAAGNWLVSNWAILGTILIAGVALWVSIESKGVAQRAVDQAQRALEQTERPYLQVKPVTFSETEEYLRLEQRDDGLDVTLQFELKNQGRSPASDVTPPPAARVRTSDGVIESAVQAGFGELTIGPGDELFARVTLRITCADPAQAFENFSTEHEPLKVGMDWTYQGPIGEKTYKTALRVAIGRNSARVIETEMD